MPEGDDAEELAAPVKPPPSASASVEVGPNTCLCGCTLRGSEALTSHPASQNDAIDLQALPQLSALVGQNIIPCKPYLQDDSAAAWALTSFRFCQRRLNLLLSGLMYFCD